MSVHLRCGLWAAAFTVVPLALAQPARPGPDPLDAAAVVPPSVHRSSLSGYRSTDEPRVGSWKEANDRVARIGGWRAYARETAAPASAPAAAPHPHGGRP